MRRFKIEVHSLGYEDTSIEVDAPKLKVAGCQANIDKAIAAWCEHNALDVDNDWGLPFTRVMRLSVPYEMRSFGLSPRTS